MSTGCLDITKTKLDEYFGTVCQKGHFKVTRGQGQFCIRIYFLPHSNNDKNPAKFDIGGLHSYPVKSSDIQSLQDFCTLFFFFYLQPFLRICQNFVTHFSLLSEESQEMK